MNIDSAIQKSLQLRDKIKEIESSHKEELAPYKEAKNTLDNAILALLQKSGVQSAKSDHGTAYLSTRTSSPVTDWEEFREFVVKEELWHLLYQRASTKAVEEYLEETGDIPPGVKVSREITLNVRKS